VDLSKAVLVPKATKVEHDMKRLGLTRDALVAYYREENAEVIFASHDRQRLMRRHVQDLLPEARVVEREALTREAVKDASLVIALGGDNHFIFATHFVEATPMLGINADRVRSHGGLLAVTEENLEPVIARLRKGELAVESWPRLEVAIDGRPAGRATSEFLVGEAARRDMTRHVLRKNDGAEEEQKCSGLLISTGAGSTGWYGVYGKPFGRTDPRARWVATETFPHGHVYAQATGELGPGDVLTVRSRNDARGAVSIDCLVDVAFDYGAVATFRLTEPLRVLRID
jgi:hypothetical protein